MFNSFFAKILVPIVALMVVLGASFYFVVLRTVNEFAQQNIEKDLDSLTHELFNVVDHEFMEVIKSGRADDQVAVRIGQVDCLDILERNTYSHHFKLIVFEQQTDTIRLESDLPGQVNTREIIQRFQAEKDNSLLQVADDEFHVRQFYFSPWDWNVLVLKNTRTYSELSQKVHRVYQTSAIALLIATILLVFYLLRSIRKPISSIISSVSQEELPEYSGTYEFEYLSRSIGEMMTSLKSEVAERKRAEKEAEEASQAKSEFLANMSHELRTPLNAILGFAQIMERDKKKSSHKESIRIIRRSGNHLLTLINQILDLSKIEAGRTTLDKNSFDMVPLLSELKNMSLLKIAQKELTLIFEISQEVPRNIYTDEIKLRQVLINLLSNAVKFTEEGVVILRISVHHRKAADIIHKNKSSPPPLLHFYTDCLLNFEVEDSGEGIAPGEIKNLFEDFGQASSSRKISDGTGLGLAISSKFVDLLGGKISLVSNVGKGSTFSFTIPVQAVNEEEMEPSMPISKVVGLEPGQPSYRILIVDDKWDNRQLLFRLLDPFGFELREAASGQEALEIQEVWSPHLILMDIRMPGMDGLEAIKIIRARASLTRQPVIIAVTAVVLQNKLEALLRDGCDDIVIKPFKEDDLFEMLRKHLNVKFVYERGPLSVEAVDLKTETLKPSPSDFFDLPDEIVHRLKKSVAALKMHETLDVIEEIRKQNEPLADTLQEFVIKYRFDTIAEAIANQGEQP